MLTKIKIVITLAIGIGITVLYPAHASAPKAEIAMIHLAIAKTQPKNYAEIKMREYGWGDKQLRCLKQLWGKESAWNRHADNPHSTAFGIAQMLGEKSRNPVTQINNGLRYIEHRYDNPCNAWQHWQRNRWY